MCVCTHHVFIESFYVRARVRVRVHHSTIVGRPADHGLHASIRLRRTIHAVAATILAQSNVTVNFLVPIVVGGGGAQRTQQ